MTAPTCYSYEANRYVRGQHIGECDGSECSGCQPCGCEGSLLAAVHCIRKIADRHDRRPETRLALLAIADAVEDGSLKVGES